MKARFLVLIGTLLFQFNCSSSKNHTQSKNYQHTWLLKYYIQVDTPNFTINTIHIAKEIETIKLNRPDDFRIVSATPTHHGTDIEISRITDKLFDSLIISFPDNTNTSREIHLRFYSKMYRLREIKFGETIVFKRSIDIAPPIFVMPSLQVGKFIMCKNDSIIEQFELLQDLYYYSLRKTHGNYGIGETSCENTYFNLDLQ